MSGYFVFALLLNLLTCLTEGSYSPAFKAIQSLVQFGDFDNILVTNEETPELFRYVAF